MNFSDNFQKLFISVLPSSSSLFSLTPLFSVPFFFALFSLLSYSFSIYLANTGNEKKIVISFTIIETIKVLKLKKKWKNCKFNLKWLKRKFTLRWETFDTEAENNPSAMECLLGYRCCSGKSITGGPS